MKRLNNIVFGLTIIGSSLAGVACDSAIEVDDPVDLCVAREADIDLEFAVTATDWPIDGGGMGPGATQAIVASCTVASAAVDSISLTCSDNAVTDGTVTVSFAALPSGFSHGLAAGQSVDLDYAWNGYGHHQQPGMFVTLHDGANNELLLTLVNGTYLSSASAAMTDLSLSMDDGLCESPCGEAIDCNEPHRAGIRIDADADAVLDGTRSERIVGGKSFDVFVARAEIWRCLNCESSIDIAIVPAGD